MTPSALISAGLQRHWISHVVQHQTEHDVNSSGASE